MSSNHNEESGNTIPSSVANYHLLIDLLTCKSYGTWSSKHNISYALS